MSNAVVPISQSKHDKIVIVHAVFGSVAGLILMPAAILVGRYLRAWPQWKKVHMAFNVTVLVFVILALVLGLVADGIAGGRDPVTNISGDNAHDVLGWIVLGIIVVQAVVGIAMPYFSFLKAPDYNYVVLQKRRHWIRFGHIILGIAGLVLLWVQINLGFGYWNSTSESNTTVPKAVTVIYYVLIALAAAAYLLGWAVMEPAAHKKRAREMQGTASSPMEQKQLVRNAA